MSEKAAQIGWYVTFLTKSIIYSSGILGVGYLCWKYLTPSEEEMRKRMNIKSEQLAKNAAQNTELKRFIEYNAKSDRPIWDVRAPPKESK
ncbi:hypothetical protein HK098_001129 [Nowakowskiella sp. JEL0407]|nr:hypothetical protein HK098_001129 [Nowakowskiella sp. JEL0407]